jgi:hypothetical protein
VLSAFDPALAFANHSGVIGGIQSREKSTPIGNFYPIQQTPKSTPRVADCPQIKLGIEPDFIEQFRAAPSSFSQVIFASKISKTPCSTRSKQRLWHKPMKVMTDNRAAQFSH